VETLFNGWHKQGGNKYNSLLLFDQCCGFLLVDMTNKEWKGF
jgi:hypothetical protein